MRVIQADAELYFLFELFLGDNRPNSKCIK